MTDTIIVLAYIGIATLLVFAGDRVGWRIACISTSRCRGPLPRIPGWMAVPVAVLIPVLVLIGVVVAAFVGSRHPMEVVADNLELLLLAAFFITGILGGFLTHIRRR